MKLTAWLSKTSSTVTNPNHVQDADHLRNLQPGGLSGKLASGVVVNAADGTPALGWPAVTINTHRIRAGSTPAMWRRAANSLVDGRRASSWLGEKESHALRARKVTASVQKIGTWFVLISKLFHSRTSKVVAGLSAGVASLPPSSQSKEALQAITAVKKTLAHPAAKGVGQALVGLSAGVSALQLIKSCYDSIYEAVGHGTRFKIRRELNRILQDYDPSSNTFYHMRDANGRKQVPIAYTPKEAQDALAELERLSTKTYRATHDWDLEDEDNVYRSTAQHIGDQIARHRENTYRLLHNIIPFGMSFGSAAVKSAGATVGTAGLAITQAVSVFQAGVQITAINNAHYAKLRAQYDVTKAMAAHIEQQRLYNTRWRLANMAVGSVALGVTAATAGFGSAVAIAGNYAAMAGVGLANATWEIKHRGTLDKRRAQANDRDTTREFEAHLQTLSEGERVRTLSDNEKVGFCENAFLAALRGEGAHDAATRLNLMNDTAKFLHDLGLSKQTIAAMRFLPLPRARMIFWGEMYSNRVRIRPQALRYIIRSFGRISGIPQMVAWVRTKVAQRATAIEEARDALLASSLDDSIGAAAVGYDAPKRGAGQMTPASSTQSLHAATNGSP